MLLCLPDSLLDLLSLRHHVDVATTFAYSFVDGWILCNYRRLRVGCHIELVRLYGQLIVLGSLRIKEQVSAEEASVVSIGGGDVCRCVRCEMGGLEVVLGRGCRETMGLSCGGPVIITRGPVSAFTCLSNFCIVLGLAEGRLDDIMATLLIDL